MIEASINLSIDDAKSRGWISATEYPDSSRVVLLCVLRANKHGHPFAYYSLAKCSDGYWDITHSPNYTGSISMSNEEALYWKEIEFKALNTDVIVNKNGCDCWLKNKEKCNKGSCFLEQKINFS
jgi:hypothetical protein